MNEPDVVAPSVGSAGVRPRGLVVLAVLLIVGLPLAGLALVVIADQVPDRMIVDELGTAVVDGSFPTVDYDVGWTGHQVDQFTDCMGLTMGLGETVETNPVSAAIRSSTLWKCSLSAPAVQGFLAGDGWTESVEYYRYWHGYAVPVRPLVAIVGVSGARIVTALLLAVAVAGLARSFARRHGAAATAVLIGPWIVSTDFLDLPGSLPHAYGVLSIVASTWLIHEVVVRGPTLRRVVAAAFVGGAAVVYFDVMTTAPAGWALAAFASMAGAAAFASHRRLLAVGATASVAWMSGYAWMWLAKWMLASLVFGVDRVRDVIGNQASIRLDAEFGIQRGGPFGTTRFNVEVWWSQPLAPLTLAVVAGTVALLWWRRRSLRTRRVDRVILSLPVLLVVSWYETLRNHSQLHVWFTYRSVAVALGILAAAWILPIGPRHRSTTLDTPDTLDLDRVEF